MQVYIEIVLDFNPNFYIRPLSKLISQLDVIFDFIFKIMRLLYSKLEIDIYQFTIYHLYYKKKPGMIESIYKPFFFQPTLKLLSLNLILKGIISPNKAIIRLER